MEKIQNMKISATGWSPFLQLLRIAKPAKWLFFLAIGLSLFEAMAGLIVPIFTRDLIDQFSTSGLAAGSILWLVAAFIMQGLTGGFSYYLMTYLGESFVATLRMKLWDHLLGLQIPFFDQHESGELMSRITQDTNTVKALVTNHLATFVSGIVSIVGAIIILLFIDWKMTLIMLLSVPLAMLILMPLGKKVYAISLQTQDEMASFSANLGRVLSDIRLVKSSNAETVESEHGQVKVKQLLRFGLREAKIQAIVSPLMTLVVMAALVVLIGYGGARVSAGDLSAGSLVAVILYMFQIVIPFTQLASFFTAFQKAMGATAQIQELLQVEKEGEQELEQEQASTEASNEVQWGSSTEELNWDQPLRFQRVSFHYQPEKHILNTLDFKIAPGRTIAFVGPSGSGKTTVFALMERFYLPSAGEIQLGNTDIRALPLREWRSGIGYVSQDSPMMSGTIRDNLVYGLDREVSQQELMQATRLANAADFIEELPEGYEAWVGERGVKLSGGQRQRIAIARALLRNPKLLLLDEATSNLDSESEALVQHALNNLMQGRTTFIIAHRLSTVLEADEIIFLDQGVITGHGTHAELMQSHELYHKFVQQQMRMQTIVSGII